MASLFHFPGPSSRYVKTNSRSYWSLQLHKSVTYALACMVQLFHLLTFWLLGRPHGLSVQLCQGTRPLAIHFHNVVSERTTKARHTSTARTLPSLFHAVRFACCRQRPGRPKCHAPKKAKAKVHSAVNNFSISLYPSSSNFFWH